MGLFTLDSICVNWLEYDFQLNPYLTQASGSHVGNYAIQTCAYYMCSVSRVFERTLGQKNQDRLEIDNLAAKKP